MKMEEEEDSLMKNTKLKKYKSLAKKGSERKWCYENPSFSIENENELSELININFLLEIFYF